MWKKLQTVVVLLMVTVGSALFISSYLNMQHLPISATMLADDPQPEEVAKVVLDVQEIAEVGELVRFDLSKSVAQSFKWIMVPEEIDFEIYDAGRRAVFSARKPGDYMFIVAAGYNSTVDVVVHVVTIEKSILPDEPVEPDEPDEPDKPDEYPDISRPDASASLDKWMSYWCSVNTRPQDEVEKLAESFESVAAQIAAGVLQRADKIVKATADANQEALGKSLPDWLPVLRELQMTMKTLAGQGKLSTPDQHQALWSEIAKGLRYYAAQFN